MRPSRAYSRLVVPFVAFGAVALGTGTLSAGPERITVSCGLSSEYDGDATTGVVPITVTMNSGQPDYIDMTYTATDSNGNPVPCSPSTNRLYVAKGNPATDNVSVCYAGTDNVTFTAYGIGEAYGADDDSCVEG